MNRVISLLVSLAASAQANNDWMQNIAKQNALNDTMEERALEVLKEEFPNGYEKVLEKHPVAVQETLDFMETQDPSALDDTLEAIISGDFNETILEEALEDMVSNRWGDIIFDTPADKLTDYEGGWGSYVKVGIIILKIGFIILMMLLGIRAHHRRSGCTISIAILAAYSVVLVGMIVLDLTVKFIAGYFILILFSNYLNFLGLMVILRNVPTLEGAKLRKDTQLYYWIMHGLYGLCVLVTAFWLRPKCIHEKVYPVCLNFACCLFLINAGYQFVQHYRGYGLKWSEDKIEHQSTR